MFHRWRKNNAYIHAWLYQDLIGDWVVSRCWGDTATGHSDAQHTPTGSYQEARCQLKRIATNCRRKGYQPCQIDETQLHLTFPENSR